MAKRKGCSVFAFSGPAELVKPETPSKTEACPVEEQRAEG